MASEFWRLPEIFVYSRAAGPSACLESQGLIFQTQRHRQAQRDATTTSERYYHTKPSTQRSCIIAAPVRHRQSNTAVERLVTSVLKPRDAWPRVVAGEYRCADLMEASRVTLTT